MTKSRSDWFDKIIPLICHVNKIDPMQAEFHPAYRAALRRIDALIDEGLQHEFITREEAARL